MYGLANRAGQVSLREAAAILKEGSLAGLDTLDTAIAYGNAEERLGRLGVQGWRVVTKLPAVPANRVVGRWVRESLEGSLERLAIPAVHALLLHRPSQLLGRLGAPLRDALVEVKQDGMASRIGVSIYDPSELEPLWLVFKPDIVQVPLNVIDRRIVSSGWLRRIKDAGVEVHARSAFLQGLLLMKPAERPPKFSRWRKLWERWDTWLAAEQLGPLRACLSFVLGHAEIDRIVVGVDSRAQLREILAMAELSGLGVPDDLASDDLQLVNPSHWNEL